MANATLNANYNKFVDWAKQFDANSSAIVGASNMLGEGLVVDTKLGDGSGSEASRIGKVSTAQRFTIDLTGQPLPTVTNVAFSQKFTPDEVFDKQNILL